MESTTPFLHLHAVATTKQQRTQLPNHVHQPPCLTSHHCIYTMREPPDRTCSHHKSSLAMDARP
ncbi:hypothetical protein DEO72_LG1g2246 [Vigna unguiculata]|uniref:Uncharacterized protein n=1 Tax=Vigna unguiculata TaxID=3917 RepID=A0A4D6KPK9_VIGUN|nr:hypothetical protein DEO72_LG1g2246 [Vigna unguiculata]